MAKRSGGFSMIGGIRARFTKMDRCGRPLYGDHNRLVTEGFISINASANIEEGEEKTVTNAGGKTCARRAAKPKHNGYTAEIELCGAHPDLVNFLSGSPLVLNGRGDVKGFDVDTDVDPSVQGVAVEVWTDLGEGDELCADEAQGGYGYVLLPFITGGTVGDIEIGDDAVNVTISNATSKKGHSWGNGPYLVDVDEDGDPVVIGTVKPSVALRVLEVGLEPPFETVGAVPLDDPAAPAATSATPGTPGAFVPAGAFRPETVEDMDDVDADPATAWTTGQYVVLQSGDEVHWTGTAWAAGRAS